MDDVASNAGLVQRVIQLQLQCDSSYKPLAVSFFTDAILEAYGKDCDALALFSEQSFHCVTFNGTCNLFILSRW